MLLDCSYGLLNLGRPRFLGNIMNQVSIVMRSTTDEADFLIFTPSRLSEDVWSRVLGRDV
jgi:hypothetical protein